jgi:hypothetical protein
MTRIVPALIFLAALTPSIHLSAQDATSPPAGMKKASSGGGSSIQFGIKTGANFLIGSMKLQPEPKEAPTNPKGLGLQFGAYAKVPFSDMVGLRPELTFSFRRAKSEATQTTNYTNEPIDQQGNTFTGKVVAKQETDQRLQYFQVNIPLTINPSTNFRVMAGPAFGILMGGKVNTDVTTDQTGTFNGNQNADANSFTTEEKKGSAATKNFTKFEMAVVAGVGYELDMGLDFDLRFYRAIVPTFDESEGTARTRFWSNLIEFSVGYTFGN